MKFKNQLTLIKIAYILLLLGAAVCCFGDAKKGFVAGYEETGVPNAEEWLSGIMVFVAFYIGLRVLISFYLFISSIQKGDVFSQNNIQRVMSMGRNCMVLSFVLYLFYLIKSRLLQTGQSVYEALTTVDFDFWLLIFGLTLITIGFVFKKGLELQQEKDLTI